MFTFAKGVVVVVGVTGDDDEGGRVKGVKISPAPNGESCWRKKFSSGAGGCGGQWVINFFSCWFVVVVDVHCVRRQERRQERREGQERRRRWRASPEKKSCMKMRNGGKRNE